MKPASAGLETLLETATNLFWIDCYDVTLADGTQLFYCSADASLVFNSGAGNNTYLSGPPLFERETVKCSIGLQVDTCDITIKGDSTTLQNILVGKWDNALIVINRVPMPTFGDTSRGGIVIFGGNVGPITDLGRSMVKIAVQGFTQKLNHPLPRNTYQPGCRWALYDAGCTLNKASFVNSVAVGASPAPNAYQFSIAGGGAPDAEFTLGTLTFTSGANAGLSRNVRAFASQLVTLYLKLPFVPIAGDSFNIYPGCDKLQSTCLNKFNNLANFAGQPYVPIPESAI